MPSYYFFSILRSSEWWIDILFNLFLVNRYKGVRFGEIFIRVWKGAVNQPLQWHLRDNCDNSSWTIEGIWCSYWLPRYVTIATNREHGTAQWQTKCVSIGVPCFYVKIKSGRRCFYLSNIYLDLCLPLQSVSTKVSLSSVAKLSHIYRKYDWQHKGGT